MNVRFPRPCRRGRNQSDTCEIARRGRREEAAYRYSQDLSWLTAGAKASVFSVVRPEFVQYCARGFRFSRWRLSDYSVKGKGKSATVNTIDNSSNHERHSHSSRGKQSLCLVVLVPLHGFNILCPVTKPQKKAVSGLMIRPA